MKGSKIIGTGSYLPDTILTNEDLEKMVDTTDQWIKERTGIEERRICTSQYTSDLAINAGKRALYSSGIDGSDIDLIVVSTVTSESAVPSIACKVQNAIGAINAMAFDINAACSGFIFALDIANNYISLGVSKKALVIGAESLSKIVDWKDRNTCVLFGDGAGSVILCDDEEKNVSNIKCRSDGSKSDAITCKNLIESNPFSNKVGNLEKIKMNGKEVYKFAVRVMEEEFYRIIGENNLSKEDIDFVLPHQANLRMIESFSKKIDIPLSKFILNIKHRGNTSGASIPIALDEANTKGLLSKGNKILVIGFGGGLTYGSGLIKWSI